MMQQSNNLLLMQAEVVVLILAGCIALVLDFSFITFSKDMDKVWKLALDPYKFPPLTQLHLKYFLSTLVIVRTFSIHITIALYIVMLWPAIFAEREYLLIPWIFVGTIRLFVDIFSTIGGLYISSKYGVLNTLWIEFLLVQILQHGPFFYVWLTIVKYRIHLKKVEEENRAIMEQEVYKIKLCKRSRHKLLEKRKRMLEDQKDVISQSTITTIIDRISTRNKENMSTRSLDTLLELIEKGHQKEDMNSISSSENNSSEPTDFDFQSIMEKLKITNRDVEQAKKNKLSSLKDKETNIDQQYSKHTAVTFDRFLDGNSAKRDDGSLTFDLGSNEIEQENTIFTYKSEMEDDT